MRCSSVEPRYEQQGSELPVGGKVYKYTSANPFFLSSAMRQE